MLITAVAANGLCIAEAIDLRGSDVDMVNKVITLSDNRHSGHRQRGKAIRTTKGRSSRRVPIYEGLHRVLSKLSRHVDNHVFHGPRVGTLKADTVRNILVRDVLRPLSEKFPTPSSKIGFIDGRLHSFRHYFVSQGFFGVSPRARFESALAMPTPKLFRGTVIFRIRICSGKCSN